MKRGITNYLLSIFIILLLTLLVSGLENNIKAEFFVIDKSTTKNIVDISKIILTDSDGNVKKANIESIGETNTKEFVFYNLDGTYKLEISADGYSKYELNEFKINKNDGGSSLTINLEPLFKASCNEKSSVSKRIMAGTVNEINNLKIELNGLKSNNNLAIIKAGRGDIEKEINFTKDTTFQIINIDNQDYSIFLKSTEDYYATFQVFCGDADKYILKYKGFRAFFGKIFCKIKNTSSKGNQYLCILDKSLN